MKAYLDSSALVKLYYPEPESEALQGWVFRNRPEILLSPIHTLEITNAMALKVFRGEVRTETFAQWQLYFQRDQAEGVLTCYAPPWQHVLSDAELFMTNDARQGQAARECNLSVVFLSSLVR